MRGACRRWTASSRGAARCCRKAGRERSPTCPICRGKSMRRATAAYIRDVLADRKPVPASMAAAGGTYLASGPVNMNSPKVTLVGAGPGDPELLTLKAVKAIQAATVLLVDDLVSPDIVGLAARGTRGHPRRQARRLQEHAAGLHRKADGDGRPRRRERGAAQGRRSVHLRPRRRRGRAAARGGHRGRGGQRHHLGPGRGHRARRAADASRACPRRGVRHRPCAHRRRRHRLARAGGDGAGRAG